ncbi:MAG: thioredoxin family protein [Pedobacter sp.]|nr:thioredoxin family protein [Pedobacter sp.]
MKKINYCTALFGVILLLSSFKNSVPVPEIAKGNPEKKVRQINFIENSWDLALKKAKAENKYIFVDAYAVWCGPCKLLKATTFKNHEVADLFNKNFVNLSLDMEKGEGIKLAEKWGIEAYPTLLVLDSNGKVITGNVGYVTAKELLVFAQKVLKARKI